ncbi:MAG: hypothetical protein B7Y80_15125 [Hyphomicrobium sp. 32-62-53]|nr:MAG: hypothetical protein B7Z29_14350 [Hyphomicrobium sp. 12-62-95]OYX98366.1 MAG: hypothetical protein B7Y80_15125 [Hyphomicrobium sp. 32-62-53]
METANGVFAYSGTWFGLAAQPSQGAFANRRAWAESWVEPGVDGVLRIAPALELYGGAGIGVSRTWGADSFDQRNQGEVNLENAFGGIRTANLATGWNFDFSFGQQNYSVGSGMLIWQGAGNGFERGGGNLLPRQAWKNATVAKVAIAGLSLEGFYLDPNELESVDTGTQLAGAVVQYRWGQKSRAGIASMRALESEQFYPLPSAPLVGFLPGITNGRDGLEAINAFSEIDGASFGLQNAWIRAELSLERNDRIDMLAHAYYGELGYRFLALPFAPALSYAYASFSGDDPTTKRYERFDPLFYGNGLDNWWFGANGAYSFLNSNTAHHRLALQLVLSQQDFVKLQYIHTRANELFSPIQFGQATRPVLTSGGLVLVNGVANAHLADEIYAEWAHVFSKNVTMALWGSAAIPGRGIRDLVSDDATSWLGGGALLSIKY